jgi:uncharacterized membrane protein
MDQTHIHLLITHLPVFGSVLGSLVLVHGLWTKSNQTIIAAYNLFIISAIGAGIAYFTGEAAEETVENIQDIAKGTIDQHEDLAVVALISLITLGIASVVGIFLTLRNSGLTKAAGIVILLISLLSFGLVARTAYLGGQIRHTEIAKSTNPAQSHEGETKEVD